MELEQDAENESEAVSTKKAELEYVSSALQFMKAMDASMVNVCHFLGSNTPSDVSEAINFVTFASEFGLTAASIGVRKMLLLIFSKDTSIRDSVITAFERIYLKAESQSDYKSKKELEFATALRLVRLVCGATVAELVSIEECAMEVQRSGHVKTDVRDALWSMLKKPAGEVDHCALQNARAAAKLLSFFAKGSPKVVRDNLNLLLIAAGSADSWRDPVITKYALCAVNFARDFCDGANLAEVTNSVVNIATQPWCRGCEWTPALEQIVAVVFQISTEPLQVLSSMIKKLHNGAMTVVKAGKNANAEVSGPLIKLFFVIGDVAIETLVYAEEYDRKVSNPYFGPNLNN